MSEPLRIATPIVEADDDVGARPAAPAPLLLTAGDLARELRVSLKTIRRLDLAGKLPRPLRVGHAVRWPRSTIEAWLAAGCPDREEWELYRGAPNARRRRP